MTPAKEDLLLKEQVVLYNNLAKLDDCTGCLTAVLEVYPQPRVTWEFEILGEIQGMFPYGAAWESEPISPLVGHAFQVPEPLCYKSTEKVGPSNSLGGVAKQAIYGEMSDTAHLFTFYLTNTVFHRAIGGQTALREKIEDPKTGKTVRTSSGGKQVEVALDNSWSIKLYIESTALDWLEPRKGNVGVRLTSVGYLTNNRLCRDAEEERLPLTAITIEDATSRIKNLCWFLSFANGGYSTPLYVEGTDIAPVPYP
jgi:hypothetical protein